MQRFFLSSLVVLGGFVFAPAAFAATEVTVKQVSAGALGEWSIIYPGGSIGSKDEGIDGKNYVFRPNEGKLSLIATPPDGASLKTIVKKNGQIVQSSYTRQVNINGIDGDIIEFSLQYVFNISGDLGVTSEPSGLDITILDPHGNRIRAKTPWTKRNVSIGTYTVSATKRGCIKPAPVSKNVKKGERVVIHIEIDCRTAAEREKQEPKRPLRSRRSLIDSVTNRESERASRLYD